MIHGPYRSPDRRRPRRRLRPYRGAAEIDAAIGTELRRAERRARLPSFALVAAVEVGLVVGAGLPGWYWAVFFVPRWLFVVLAEFSR